jgi:outer membrane protein OmpA-like peptidoglycan-associated protein
LYNLELARKRAESIRRHLVGQAPGQLSRFHAIGLGEHAPPGEVATLGDGAERRQVVIVLVERTAPLTTTKPFAERQDGRR